MKIIISNKNRIKLEVKNRRKTGRFTNVQKLNSTLKGSIEQIKKSKDNLENT